MIVEEPRDVHDKVYDGLLARNTPPGRHEQFCLFKRVQNVGSNHFFHG